MASRVWVKVVDVGLKKNWSTVPLSKEVKNINDLMRATKQELPEDLNDYSTSRLTVKAIVNANFKDIDTVPANAVVLSPVDNLESILDHFRVYYTKCTVQQSFSENIRLFVIVEYGTVPRNFLYICGILVQKLTLFFFFCL